MGYTTLKGYEKATRRLIGMSGKPPIKVTQAPMANGIPRALIVIVIALVVIVVVFAVVPFLQNAFNPQPNVTLSNLSQPSKSGCTAGSNQYYTYTWTFTLVNNGNTNANVTVSIVAQGAQYSGASPLKSQVFTVPKASSPSETISISLPAEGCTNLSSAITPQITAQKAV